MGAKKNGKTPANKGNGDAKHPAKIQRLSKTLKVAISATEIAEAADRAAHLKQKRDEVLEEKKSAAAASKARLDEFDAEINKLLGIVRDKSKYDSVQCEEHHIFRTGRVVVVRLDTKAEIEERAMTASERQLGLPLEPKKLEAKNGKKAKNDGAPSFGAEETERAEKEARRVAKESRAQEAAEASAP